MKALADYSKGALLALAWIWMWVAILSAFDIDVRFPR